MEKKIGSVFIIIPKKMTTSFYFLNSLGYGLLYTIYMFYLFFAIKAQFYNDFEERSKHLYTVEMTKYHLKNESFTEVLKFKNSV